MAYNPPISCISILAEGGGIDLNAAAPSDIATLVVSTSEFLPKYILVHESSASASSAQIAVYTGAGATGTTVLATTTLNGITGANKAQLIDIGSFYDQLTSSNLYVRLITAAGSAATCHVAVYGFDLQH